MTLISKPHLFVAIWAVLLALPCQAQLRKARPAPQPVNEPVNEDEQTEDPNTDDNFAHRFRHIGFHFGGLTEFYNAIQTDTHGQKNRFDMRPFIGGSTDIALSESWGMMPEFNWVLPQDLGDNVVKNMFMIRLDAGYRAHENLRLRVGTSLMVSNIKGDGGTKTVSNGGATSQFYLPNESKTAINNTLDFGAEALFADFGLRFQTYLYALLRDDRRQVSYSLTLSYFYDLGN